jgi:hypothetical protein
MPAKSKKQQMAAGAALAAKRGETTKSSLQGASRQMVESMSEPELEKMASVKRKKLPTRASKGASRGASKRGSKTASKRTSKRTSKRSSKRASK